MTKRPATYPSNKPPKWLLLIAVMLGVFTFSESVFNVSLQQEEPTQIEELLTAQNPTSTAITISYKKAFAQTPLSLYLAFFKAYPANFLSAYGTVCKAKNNNLLAENQYIVPTFYFLPFKIIPQNSDEASSFSSSSFPSMG